MSDGCAVRAKCSSLTVDVDPLVIVRRISKCVNPRLLDEPPRRGPQVEASRIGEFGERNFHRQLRPQGSAKEEGLLIEDTSNRFTNHYHVETALNR